MKNYPTFEQIISRTVFGTKICIVDVGRKELFSGTLKYGDKIQKFGSQMLSSEVTSITVGTDSLVIEIAI